MTSDHISLTDDGIEFTEPDHSDTTTKLSFPNSPDQLTPYIDFYYGRPAIYIYTYNQSEPEYVILFPTNKDPHLTSTHD